MITWVTVWVLTVFSGGEYRSYYRPLNYQIQYATQATCEKKKQEHLKNGAHKSTRCDWQQVPIYKSK